MSLGALAQNKLPAECLGDTLTSPSMTLSSFLESREEQNLSSSSRVIILQVIGGISEDLLFKEAQIWAVELKVVSPVAYS